MPNAFPRRPSSFDFDVITGPVPQPPVPQRPAASPQPKSDAGQSEPRQESGAGE